ncbi:MAG: AraC family transcriptional regulator [Clostridia bacterium]|nr:AraC family transcriptional regulator [Clostridia bacterium]
MDWINTIKVTISYIENNLCDTICADEIASKMGISSYYLQKGFKLMTGYTIAEYVKNRRLYLAAVELVSGDDKVIDVAYKYGYETPESFTKAFFRFHGFNPSRTKENVKNIKVFLPLKVTIVIEGGESMDYTIEKKDATTFIGFVREFDVKTSYQDIPKFWDEINEKVMAPLQNRDFEPKSDIEKAIVDNAVCEYGICIEEDVKSGGKFKYMIGGKYNGGSVPKGMELYEVPALEWAIFKVVGPMPGALQSVNSKIYKEWLPSSEYSISAGIDIEWYSDGDTQDANYQSAIWIPIKK